MLARAGVAVDRLAEVFDALPEIPSEPSGKSSFKLVVDLSWIR